MRKRILKWIKRYYNKVINSIAFYPALIAIGFLLLSYLMLLFDFSEQGKSFKARLDFISLRDASTARTIAATIAGGILSLAVFSFSMVMILLNQAASNMSNRVLDSMIGNRFQQWVLGFYIGTIVYSLFLLSTIRDIDSGIYVPALSVYLLILLTIIDIFLFIYFLHYITQSVKYETIIERIYNPTYQELKRHCHLTTEPTNPVPLPSNFYTFKAQQSGYFQGIEQKALLEMCMEQNWILRFYISVGDFIIKGAPMLAIYSSDDITEEQEDQLDVLLNFYRGEPISANPYYGFKQLAEVAVRALSPGINDPGTAILSVHALTDLFAYRMNRYPDVAIPDEHGTQRILMREADFEELFERTIRPVWDYGKEDRLLRSAMQRMLEQMIPLAKNGENRALLEQFYLETKQPD